MMNNLCSMDKNDLILLNSHKYEDTFFIHLLTLAIPTISIITCIIIMSSNSCSESISIVIIIIITITNLIITTFIFTVTDIIFLILLLGLVGFVHSNSNRLNY